MYVVAVVVISLVVSGVCGFIWGSQVFWIVLLCTFFGMGIYVFAMYFTFRNDISNKIMKKTVAKHEAEQGFMNSATFTSYKAIVKIDVTTGRFAYVAWMNPWEFQVFSFAEVEKIESGYRPGPFGGTNYIYFDFYYKGKRVRIPTFVAIHGMFRMDSQQVLDGISKADAYAELLKQAKENAIRLQTR